jgi:hypothetical protein
MTTVSAGFLSVNGTGTFRSAEKTRVRRLDGLCTTRGVIHSLWKGHFSRRDIRRSASCLPPVWQVGQYCNDRSL